MKILIQQFRANDLNPSEGKQIEFGKNAFEELTDGKQIEGKIKFIYKSEDALNGFAINVICTYIPDRTNYKLYQSNEESLKKFFLLKLNLTEDSVGKDYFTISYSKNNFNFSYFPASSEVGKFFENNKLSGNIINIIEKEPITIKKSRNRIIFGAPGTGKSCLLDKESKGFNETIELLNQFETDLKELSEPNHTMADYTAFGLKYYNRILYKYMNEDSFSGSNFKNDYEKDISKEVLNSGTLLDNISRACNGLKKLNTPIITTNIYKSNIERVTFHPNYSYAQFVGTYKPVSIKENGKTEISYEYVPGPFIITWIRAYKSGQPQLLIIEEINRANVAAVFGDVFQLLDRDSYGNSEYPITISNDLKKFLLEKEGIDIDTMIIPSNMYIWATMNSADQGVLPMDAAFKRRWDFEYLNIDNGAFDINIPIYNGYENDNKTHKYSEINWNTLRVSINETLKKIPGVNEDKLLGPFFIGNSVKIEELIKDKEEFNKLFKSKVLMYLFEDVVKMNPSDLFNTKENENVHYSDICNKFDNEGLNIFVKSISDKFDAIKNGEEK